MTRRRRRNRADAVPDHTREEIDVLNREDLVKRFVREENNILTVQKQKKDDGTLKDIREQIKELGYSNQEEIDEFADKLKELKAVDEECAELVEQKKALERGYREELKGRKAVRKYVYEKVQSHYR